MGKNKIIGVLLQAVGVLMATCILLVAISGDYSFHIVGAVCWWVVILCLIDGGAFILEKKSKKKSSNKSKSITVDIKILDIKLIKIILRDFVKLIDLVCRSKNVDSKTLRFASICAKKYKKSFADNAEVEKTCSTCRYVPEKCGWLCTDCDIWEAKENLD